MNNFIFANGDIAKVKITGSVGHVTARWDNLSGANYYNVVHLNAAGDRVAKWYPQYELQAPQPGDAWDGPPGIPFINIKPPQTSSDQPGGLSSSDTTASA